MSSTKLFIYFSITISVISFHTTNAQLIEQWRVDIPPAPGFSNPDWHYDAQGNAYGIRSKYISADQWAFNITKVSAEGILEWTIDDTPFLGEAYIQYRRASVDSYGNVYIVGTIYDNPIYQAPFVVKYSAGGVKLFQEAVMPNGFVFGETQPFTIGAWGTDSEGITSAFGVFNVQVDSLIIPYGRVMSISTNGANTLEHTYDGGTTYINFEQSNGPKGPDMYGNYISRFWSITSDNKYINHFVGTNGASGILWSASSPPSFDSDPHWNLTNYKVFRLGNMYYNQSGSTEVSKYSSTFQHQWTKNYTNYGVIVYSENPFDESVIIYEPNEIEHLACYNSDGTLRWRNTNPIPNYLVTTYGPENDIYTITGYSNPARAMRINYLTGEIVWTDTIALGPNYWYPGCRLLIESVGAITFAGADRVLKFLQGIEITHPQKDTLLIAGEVDTIRWNGGIENQFLSLEYSIDGGSTYNWINLDQVEASEGKYGWDIPDDLIGRKALIRILNAANGDSLGASDTFKIKPYIITRVDENGEYVAYDINTDRWGFWNDDPDVWPLNWYQNFDYWGIDPFTNKNYSVWQGDSVFYEANDSDHPDWVSFVNTFGVDACYADIYIGSYWPKALELWKSKKSNWKGSCYGIAISNALAFEKRDQFQTVYQYFPDIITPRLVTSDTNTIKVVNELFTHQFGNPHEANLVIALQKTPNQTLNELKDLLREDNVTIRTLSFFSNDPLDQGAHAILGYKIKKDNNIDDRYYIYVYDNSNPDSLNAYVRIDTSANGGNGSWNTSYAWQNWGGDKYLFLEDTASSFFTNPVLPKKSKYISPFVLAENDLQILSSPGLNTLIIDEQGNQTGIGSSGMTINIPGSYPLIKRNGSSGPPYGYYLPTDNYSVVMNNFLADTLNTYFFKGNKSFSYERYGATNSQTDRLFFDGGVSVINPDAEEKMIKLVNITATTDDEKVFILRSLELVQNDSVKIEKPDDNKLDLISYGSEKNYQIELNRVSQSGLGRFLNSNVSLQQNTTHKLNPNWVDIMNTNLMILVDIGNDGTIDDTLNLENEVTGIGDDQGSLIPTEYRLEQNYPNPFNSSTKISWQAPIGSHQSLKIYDVLGNEVATLVDEFREAGRYEIEFDASPLASGIYLYKLQAGSNIQTRKMILLK